jgi:8-oxo-dGTP diphosphatase
MIDVTCAVIRNEDDEVLIVQRGEFTDHPLKWEFPGGKINKGESEEDCIFREIKEELSIDIVICSRLPEVIHDYGLKKIRLIPFICDTLDEFPFLSEHVDFKWVSAEQLSIIDFSEADVYVAESYLGIDLSGRREEPGSISESEQSAMDDEGLQSLVNSMMSMKEAEWVAVSAVENPAIFKKLLEYSFSPDKKLAFRASWTLTKVCDKYPELIYPHLPGIIDSLDSLDNESVQRSFLRILSLTDIRRLSVKQHGTLTEHCFNALKSGFSAIAIKAYSMEIIYNLVLMYPELLNEFSATVNLVQGEGSAGIIARGQMIMKKLAKTPLSPKSSQK